MRAPEAELEALRAQDLFRSIRSQEPGRHPGVVEIDGRSLIQFASNDYLGLAGSDELREVLAEAVRRHGAGTGASRLVSGTRPVHTALEEELAEFKATEAALTFSSGFAVAVGTIPALVGKGDVVILDKLCHACLVDGARLSGATLRVFPHGDLGKLESHLDWARRHIGPQGRVIVLVESVYSMDGDQADLASLVELKDRAEALLLVDEAHAVGLYGPDGAGLAAEQGVAERIDFHMGTLSKAFGLSGGYLAARRPWIDLLVNRARSFIYSTAPPAAISEAGRQALRMIRGAEGKRRRAALWANVTRLDAAMGWCGLAPSPIRPVQVGESAAALALARELAGAGYQVPAIRFPTVPRGTARLRLSLGSEHEASQIEGVARVLLETVNRGRI